MTSVSIDVELDEFNDDDLIRDLKDRKIVTNGEEKMLLERAKNHEKTDALRQTFDSEYFERATDYARRGNAEECAFYLALAFPQFHVLQRACAHKNAA